MKTETGVMVMKGGKAWGVVYEDGHSTSHDWMDPESAPIRDPRFCKKPTDVTYAGSPDVAELSTARLVCVKRTTIVTILPSYEPNT